MEMSLARHAAALGLVASAAAAGCGGSEDDGVPRTPGLGDSCIPAPEYDPRFSGFSETEVTLDVGNEQCETRLCLVNHFWGRVSCPYGQTEEDVTDWLNSGTDWGNRCRVAGTDGTLPEDRIAVPVWPQKYARRAAQAVYCSCRCANAAGNTDDGQSYCRCPDGFVCQHLVDDVGLGHTELTGSYCVKAGSEYDEIETEGSPQCTLDFGYPGGAAAHPYYCGEAIPF
jgi:hypothetical protein